MAALLQRMVRDRFVSRKPNPKDSRAQLVVLTARAKTVLIEAQDAMKRIVDEALVGISEADQKHLISTLQTVIRNLSDDPSNLAEPVFTALGDK